MGSRYVLDLQASIKYEVFLQTITLIDGCENTYRYILKGKDDNEALLVKELGPRFRPITQADYYDAG